jgi:pilus assembly protein CpaC
MHRFKCKRKFPSHAATLMLGLTLSGGAWAQELKPLIPSLGSAPGAGFNLPALGEPPAAGKPAPMQQPPAANPQTPPITPPGLPPGAQPAVLRSSKVVISIGSTQKLQEYTKKNLVKAETPRANIVKISPIDGDPTTVLLTGLEAGTTQITLTDVDGKIEVVDVVVQFDVQYLKTLLQQTVPTANITPVPGGNNSVILTGSVARAEDVQPILATSASVVGGADHVINAMRVGGVMQVQLDVKIATVSRDLLRRMSFDFFTDGQNHTFASTVGQGFLIPSAGITGALPTGFPIISNTVGSPNGAPPNLFLGLFNSKQDFFGLLQALRNENLIKVLAEPTLVTLSGKSASFISGGEQAIPVPAGLGQVGVQFEEFGTRLNFLPILLGDGKIWIEVEPEISNLNPAFGTVINGTSVPGRSTQRVHTTVMLEPGQTFVIGGLIERRVIAATAKVPIIGELPFLGAAFSAKSYDETETELLISVTPYLVDPQSCDQAPKVFPGQETRSPDDFELFLEGILEAPRGPRQVFPDHHYVPAFKNGPTASTIPCAGGKDGACKTPGCTSCEVGKPVVATGPSTTASPAVLDARTNVEASSTKDQQPTNLPSVPGTRGAGDR